MRSKVWLAGLMLLTGTALAPPADAAQVKLFGSYDYDSGFSPNADGRHDTWQLRFSLRRTARVTAVVKGSDKAIRRFDLGRLRKGSHQLVWDGRAHGHVTPDGFYGIVVTASNTAGKETLHLAAEVDTVNRGRLVTSRPVVYPKATAVAYDYVTLVFLEKGWTPDNAMNGIYQARSTLTIADADGRVVSVQRHGYADVPNFSWDAGWIEPVPEGDYVATLVSEDAAGNRARRSVRLSVSYDQLAVGVWSGTVAASDASRYEPYSDGCNGCGERCLPTPGQRFAGGLTFGPCATYFWTRDHFSMDVPFAPAPVDEYRVLADGGPTTAGGEDRGWLVVAERFGVQTAVGDGTTASPWVPVSLTTQPYLPGLHRPAVWSFSTDAPASYDVATFTVEYRHYVPVG
jgi:hypothetical protein